VDVAADRDHAGALERSGVELSPGLSMNSKDFTAEKE
jgi:hypothetical protein